MGGGGGCGIPLYVDMNVSVEVVHSNTKEGARVDRRGRVMFRNTGAKR